MPPPKWLLTVSLRVALAFDALLTTLSQWEHWRPLYLTECKSGPIDICLVHFGHWQPML